MIKTTNPYNGSTIKEYAMHSPVQLTTSIANAASAFENWKLESIKSRTKLLHKVSELLLERKQEYAELMTREMGKPISQSIAEIEKCAHCCNFYVENAAQFLADELIVTDADESFISKDPMGAILAIMPWNFPFWQVIRFAAPNLTAGNTILLKHASNTTGCALAIEQLFIDAGYPTGCFQTILTDHESIENCIADKRIKGVTLTGSGKAGKAVAELAGKHLKKSVMELGGNNACIVWEDADLEKYMETIVKARMQNTGQSCIAAKRFVVVDVIYDNFVAAFKEHIQLLKSGNPMEPHIEIGVMAREDLVVTLEEQIGTSVNKGAKVTHGNLRDGNYFEPTVLEEVVPGMPAFDDELFGPVAAIVRAKDRADSISIAANSTFGLGTMLFTEDIDAARKMVGAIPDGAFFINEMVKSDPRLPFGGTKNSGYGRELSKEGMLEFVNKKTVYIRK
ncbi:NAD-dependent succinate-semialdehyde dehydrogenase [Maribacter chungangensis]|uniref:NAD-dependent succinate-semialdehyde dehydrogenase n=1 Tax=Maribacter chungangensis TaxID=1069117 RepID=A0ABW3B682_9FLAO